METEASSFESSEMVANFIASTPLLSNSWKLCDSANCMFHESFVTEQIGGVGYVAFSGVQPVGVDDGGSLEVVDSTLFACLRHHSDEEDDGGDKTEDPVMIHSGFLRAFLSIYSHPTFQHQIAGIVEKSKSIVMTGHSAGGTIASLCALWLLSYLETESISNISVLCITFGSPLLGNQSLSRAILRQRWNANFCHVISKNDIVPRLLFSPLITPHLHSLLNFYQLSMTITSPHLTQSLSSNLPDQTISDIFTNVLASMQQLIQPHPRGAQIVSAFSPFGNYFFCSQDGAICIDNTISVVKMMHLLLSTTTPISSIQDHLKYGDYVGRISFHFLNKRSFLTRDFPQSSYEAGVSLALQSSGIGSQDRVAQPAKDCLKLARRMGRTPCLNCANLAIRLSQITPYRVEIQWYKACCDESDDQLGYYDSFKQRGASKKDYKVNMNRHKLNQFWDNVINMLENNNLPPDFHRRAKWINASQFYKLLVEPLDIAEYYRTGMHLSKGHYISHGRERRYKIFDRWWNNRTVKEEERNKTRSQLASLTQDTCFWAKVEEAREWLDNLRSEVDPRNQANLRDNIDVFERYARELVERKEVSKDVLAKNSSYCMWIKDYQLMKEQIGQVRPQFPSFRDGEVVP
ncbi:alpha/beta-Hydrolases superfamily protein [Euphorbia peplus]|nr:alpha/beta-Hydrolases superfamily protein [Euphorbia peplus]